MNTTISISKETRKMLQDFGRKSESYDDIVRRLFNQMMMHEKIQELVDKSGYSSIEDVKEWFRLKYK